MRAGRSRSWVAWAASVVVHAAVVVIVMRAGQRGALRAPAPEPEVVELDFEIRGDPEGDTPSLSGGPSPRRAGRGDLKVVPSPSGRTDEGAPASPAESSPSSSSSESSPSSPIDLSIGALPDDVKGRFAGTPGPEGTLRARPRRFAVDELRVELERQQDAVANVEKGRADPLLYDYLRGARARFQETADKLADDLAVGPGNMVRGWGRGYLRTVEDANRGKIGAKLDAPREGGGDERNEISPHADVLGGYNEAQRQAESGAEERRAEVCLDVAAGRETAVVLRRSSGNAALDRLTVESFTKAIAARPVPPDTRGGLACYELRISAYRIPPLPFVSCGIGRAGLTCYWPFKKVTSVGGRLLGVEYPPTDGGGKKAGPSLLRKPR